FRSSSVLFIFFFQAEDGIRDRNVTGVQTCALPISTQGKQIDALNAASLSNKLCQMANGCVYDDQQQIVQIHQRKLDALEDLVERSEERRVGKECSDGGSAYDGGERGTWCVDGASEG